MIACSNSDQKMFGGRPNTSRTFKRGDVPIPYHDEVFHHTFLSFFLSFFLSNLSNMTRNIFPLTHASRMGLATVFGGLELDTTLKESKLKKCAGRYGL